MLKDYTTAQLISMFNPTRSKAPHPYPCGCNRHQELREEIVPHSWEWFTADPEGDGYDD